MASAPFEIVIGHPQVYLAPSATAYPDVDSAPAAAWVLLGGGNLKQNDDGVTITHTHDIVSFTPGGKTLPTKRSRVSEEITIAATIMDLTLEAYTYAINASAIHCHGNVSGHQVNLVGSWRGRGNLRHAGSW